MKQLLLSAYAVNYRDYDRMTALLDACGFADLGAELSMFTGTSRFPDFMEELAAVRDRFSAYYVSFHGPYSEVEATSPLTGGAHRIMLEAYAQAFQFCRDFSAHTIVMHTNQRIDLTGDNSALRENCAATIREIGRMAENTGSKLLVENVGIRIHHNVLFPMEEFIRLFDELPRDIGCLIDVGHAFANGWDVPELIRRLGDRIVSYHLHNNDGVHDSHRMLFGEGLYYGREDWRRLFAVMEEYTPDADWVMEYSYKNEITEDRLAGEVREILAMLDGIDG